MQIQADINTETFEVYLDEQGWFYIMHCYLCDLTLSVSPSFVKTAAYGAIHNCFPDDYPS